MMILLIKTQEPSLSLQENIKKVWPVPIKIMEPFHLAIALHFFFFLLFIFVELLHAGPSSMFKKFSYKETKKATDNFSFVIGQGGFGTVYKAQFSDGLVAAVKRMDKVSEQAEDEFCKEIELLARLHHRHLVALRGFCIERHERLVRQEDMCDSFH